MNELVYLKNDEAVCDSLQVAEKFGKRHDKLIAEIRRMYTVPMVVAQRNVQRMSSGSVRKLRQVCIIPTKI